MDQEQKRTSIISIIVIVVIVSIIFLVFLSYLIIYRRLHSESHGSGVTVHFPSTWVEGRNYYSNSDGSCSVSMKMTTRSIKRIKEELAPYEMVYDEEFVSGVSMQHGYVEDDDQFIHAYIFKHPNLDKNYYLIYTQYRSSEASDCGEFIDDIDSRIVIDY